MSDCGCGAGGSASLERRTLLMLLCINGFIFFGKAIIGCSMNQIIPACPAVTEAR